MDYLKLLLAVTWFRCCCFIFLVGGFIHVGDWSIARKLNIHFRVVKTIYVIFEPNCEMENLAIKNTNKPYKTSITYHLQNQFFETIAMFVAK